MTARVKWMPAWRMLLAALMAALAVTVVSVGTQAASAPPAVADTCGPVACPSAGDIACALFPAGCAAQAAVGGVSSQVADAVASAAEAFMTVIVKGVAAGAQAMFDQVAKFMTGATRANVTAGDFVSGDGAYHKVAEVSALLMIGFLFLAIIQGTLRGEPGQTVLSFVRSAPLAVLAIIGLPVIVDLLLGLVDAICAFLLPTGATLATIAKVFAADQVQSALSGGFASLPVLLCELFAFFGAVLIFAELIVRDALVLVTVALAPLSFAAMVWPAARGAARRAGELLAAVILSKLAIWVALLVGINLFAKQAFGPGPGAWGQMIAGSAVLAVAIFSPFVVWRLLPVAEAAIVAQGLSRAPARAAQQGMYAANSARSMTSGRGGGGGGGGHPSQGGQSQPGLMATRSLGQSSSGGGSSGGGSSGGGPPGAQGSGSTGPPGANGASGPAGPQGVPGPATAPGAGAGGGAAGGGAAGGGAAGGGAAAGGAAAGGAAVAAPVAAAAAVGKAAKDKATGSADSQSSSNGNGGGSGWGYAP